MGTPSQRLSFAARSLIAGGFFLVAAAVFHFIAAAHISMILKNVLDVKFYELLEPIVSFTFLLNGVLFLPLSFGTFSNAAGIRRGVRWPCYRVLANVPPVLVPPGFLVP